MTTKDAIKLLPIDEKLKIQVLNMYDYLEPAQKLTIEVIAWKTYFMQHEERVNINLEKALEAAAEGNEKLGKDFYANVLKKTAQEEQKDMSDRLTNTDLAAARHAMEQIMNEIHAHKKSSKAKN